MNHKLNLKILYIVANIIIVFGFIAPMLISTQSDLLVVVGIVLIVTNSYHLVTYILNITKSIKQK